MLGTEPINSEGKDGGKGNTDDGRDGVFISVTGMELFFVRKGYDS